MSASVIWTSENDELLIDFVTNHEALYNVRCPDYRKAQLKQHLWKNVGAILQKPGSDCCKRWTYVRDYYVRRRGKPGTGSGGDAAKKRSDLLSFLDSIPSSQKENTITNVVGDEPPIVENENEITHDTQDDSEGNTIQDDGTERNNNIEDDNEGLGGNDTGVRNSRKRKLTQSEERLQLLREIAQQKLTPVQHELDENDLFFSLMAKTVERLPQYEQVQLRMEISSLVGTAELSNISNQSVETSDSLSTPKST